MWEREGLEEVRESDGCIDRYAWRRVCGFAIRIVAQRDQVFISDILFHLVIFLDHRYQSASHLRYKRQKLTFWLLDLL